MSTAITSDRACARIEPLEHRLLLSASPEKFNLMSLLGYDRLGASYKHRTTTTIASDIGAGGSSTVSTKTSIAAKKKMYDGHACNVVKTAVVGGSTTATTAWYRDSSGIYSTAQFNSGGGVTITAELEDTRVGPKMLTAGKKYTDRGTFDGSFRANAYGEIVSGEFDGTTSASAKIFGRERITVRGKTYARAVKGVFTIALNGTIEIEVDDESVSTSMKATATTTFWSAPGIGVVRADNKFVVDVAVPDEGPVKVTATSRSDLVSYVLT
jgi:hypothetical protein